MNVATVLQAGASLLWIVIVALIVLAVVRAQRGQAVRATQTTILVLAVVAVLLTSVAAGLVFIEPPERGVVISALAPGGYRQEPLDPGLSWIIPFFERVVRYPISRQTYTMSMIANEGQVQGDDAITARTADGQEVFIDASVIYQVNPAEVVQVHIDWQDRYNDELVRPLARGVIRDAVSQFGVEEVYSTQRNEMALQIRNALAEKLQANGLVLVEFVMRNITFSPEYAASVEQKQIAEQTAEQARFVVEQRKQEAEQARQVAQGQADASVINAQGAADARLIQAEAEAQALEMIAESLAGNEDLLTYNYINKIAPGVQVMLVPNNSPFLLPLPTMGPQAPGQSENGTELIPTPAPTAVPTLEPTPVPTAAP